MEGFGGGAGAGSQQGGKGKSRRTGMVEEEEEGEEDGRVDGAPASSATAAATDAGALSPAAGVTKRKASPPQQKQPQHGRYRTQDIPPPPLRSGNPERRSNPLMKPDILSHLAGFVSDDEYLFVAGVSRCWGQVCALSS
ncbi:unnamed protein product, partial [Ectocarpus sp. 12 AP-2014]